MLEFFLDNPKWTTDQRKVLEIDKSAIIKGCAGSGKTLLCLYLAKKLSKQGSCQIILYTRALAAFCSEGLNKLGISETIVSTYHSWDKRSVDYLIIDEAQDFSREAIEKMMSLARKRIYLFGSDQSLYSKFDHNATVTMEEIKTFSGHEWIELTKNFRNTDEIYRVANHLSNKSYPLSGEQGPKPVFKCFKSVKDEMEFIVKLIREEKSKDCAILLPINDKRRISLLPVEFEMPGILELKDYLDKELKKEFGEFQCGYKYKEADALIFFQNKPTVNLMTIHSSKGLQFEMVILPFGFGFQLEPLLGEGRKGLYVAMTRACRKLFITYTHSLMDNPYNSNKLPKEFYDGTIKLFSETPEQRQYEKELKETERLIKDNPDLFKKLEDLL